MNYDTSVLDVIAPLYERAQAPEKEPTTSVLDFHVETGRVVMAFHGDGIEDRRTRQVWNQLLRPSGDKSVDVVLQKGLKASLDWQNKSASKYKVAGVKASLEDFESSLSQVSDEISAIESARSLDAASNAADFKARKKVPFLEIEAYERKEKNLRDLRSRRGILERNVQMLRWWIESSTPSSGTISLPVLNASKSGISLRLYGKKPSQHDLDRLLLLVKRINTTSTQPFHRLFTETPKESVYADDKGKFLKPAPMPDDKANQLVGFMKEYRRKTVRIFSSEITQLWAWSELLASWNSTAKESSRIAMPKGLHTPNSSAPTGVQRSNKKKREISTSTTNAPIDAMREIMMEFVAAFKSGVSAPITTGKVMEASDGLEWFQEFQTEKRNVGNWMAILSSHKWKNSSPSGSLSMFFGIDKVSGSVIRRTESDLRSALTNSYKPPGSVVDIYLFTVELVANLHEAGVSDEDIQRFLIGTNPDYGAGRRVLAAGKAAQRDIIPSLQIPDEYVRDSVITFAIDTLWCSDVRDNECFVFLWPVLAFVCGFPALRSKSKILNWALQLTGDYQQMYTDDVSYDDLPKLIDDQSSGTTAYWYNSDLFLSWTRGQKPAGTQEEKSVERQVPNPSRIKQAENDEVYRKFDDLREESVSKYGSTHDMSILYLDMVEKIRTSWLDGQPLSHDEANDLLASKVEDLHFFARVEAEQAEAGPSQKLTSESVDEFVKAHGGLKDYSTDVRELPDNPNLDDEDDIQSSQPMRVAGVDYFPLNEEDIVSNTPDELVFLVKVRDGQLLTAGYHAAPVSQTKRTSVSLYDESYTVYHGTEWKAIPGLSPTKTEPMEKNSGKPQVQIPKVDRKGKGKAKVTVEDDEVEEILSPQLKGDVPKVSLPKQKTIKGPSSEEKPAPKKQAPTKEDSTILPGRSTTTQMAGCVCEVYPCKHTKTNIQALYKKNNKTMDKSKHGKVDGSTWTTKDLDVSSKGKKVDPLTKENPAKVSGIPTLPHQARLEPDQLSKLKEVLKLSSDPYPSNYKELTRKEQVLEQKKRKVPRWATAAVSADPKNLEKIARGEITSETKIQGKTRKVDAKTSPEGDAKRSPATPGSKWSALKAKYKDVGLWSNPRTPKEKQFKAAFDRLSKELGDSGKGALPKLKRRPPGAPLDSGRTSTSSRSQSPSGLAGTLAPMLEIAKVFGEIAKAMRGG